MDATLLVVGEHAGSVALGHVTGDDVGGDACRDERFADVLGVVDGGGEDHGLAVAGQPAPLLDDSGGDGLLVHDLLDLKLVEVGHSLDALKFRPQSAVDDEYSRPYQVAGGDDLGKLHHVGHVVEDLDDGLAVPALRGGRDPEYLGLGVTLAHLVDDAPISFSGYVVGLVHDDPVQGWGALKVVLASQRLDHGEGHPWRPAFAVGGVDVRLEGRGDALERLTVLIHQLIAVLEDEATATQLGAYGGERAGFTKAGGCYGKRVAVLCQGRFDAADKLSLSVAELHVCFLENERRPERPPTGASRIRAWQPDWNRHRSYLPARAYCNFLKSKQTRSLAVLKYASFPNVGGAIPVSQQKVGFGSYSGRQGCACSLMG